jgi:hypothetical membrane protein
MVEEHIQGSFKDNFILVLKGQANKRAHGIFFLIVLVYFGISVIFAQILHSEGFTITEHYISDLGHTEDNPIGAWFFIIGASITAILLIPHFIYMHKRIMPTLGLITKLMTLSAIVGCIGLFLVAVTPKNIDEIYWLHDIAADIAFTGLGVSAGLSLFVMFRKLTLKEEKPGILGFLVIYGISILIGVVVVLTEDSFQQWFGFFAVLAWVILSFLWL